MFNGFGEVMVGVTDLPLAILACLIGCLSIKKNKEWGFLFFLISASAAMGAAVHIFAFSPGRKKAIWIVLYLFLFELIRRFVFLTICVMRKTQGKEYRLVWILEAGLYLATVVWMFTVPDINDIYVFCVFIGFMFLRWIVCFFTTRPVPKKILALLLFLLIPFLLQTLEAVIPFAVVAEHLCLCAALCFAYITFVKKDAD